jgi:septal ring factor EnvC (AmiA/AmiB activator)
MLRRLLALGETLPEWSSRIVRRPEVIPAIQMEGEINQPARENHDVTSQNESSRSIESNHTPYVEPIVESVQFDRRNESARQSLRSPSALIKDTVALSEQPLKKIQPQTASDVIEAIQISIVSMQAVLDLVNQLGRHEEALKQEKDHLDARLEESQHQLAGLRTANSRLEHDLNRVTHECDTAQSDVKRLSADLDSVKAQLSKEQANRAEDGKKFSEQIEREKQFALNGLKGKLRGSLNPIFENKRTTDHQQLNAELAGLFRHWFNEVEEKLKVSGIELS